jgi:hypothetical protein
VLAAAAVTALLGVLAAAPGAAAPSSSPAPAPGQKVCDVNDEHLGNDNVTGLAATAKGYDVVNDNDPSQTVQVYQIGTDCKVQPLVQDQRQPNMPEDLAVTPDGSVWVADIGDPTSQRQSVAVWKFTGNNDGAKRYHLSYPDGPHNAAAMLVSPNGSLAIVTKDPGVGKVYVPTGPLTSEEQTVSMKLAGSIKLTATGTPGGPIGQLGQRVFTGGAVSPDGKRAVLRTYTDAYEWDVTGGDVATSVVKGKPRRTPLPNEPAGEAISYSTDGKYFLTMADAKSVVIDRYVPAVPVAAKPSDAAAKSDSGGLFGSLTLTDITNIVIVVGVIGLVLLVVGFVGVRRARRNQPPEEDDPLGGGGPDGPFDDGATAVIPRYTDDPPSAGAARLRQPPADRGRVPPPRHPAVPDDVDTDVIGVVRDEPIPPRGRSPELRAPRGAARPDPSAGQRGTARPEPPTGPRGAARPEPPVGPRGTARSQPAKPDTGWSAGSRWRDEERPRGGRGGQDYGRDPYDRDGDRDRYERDRYDRDAPYDQERPSPRRGGYPDEPEPYRPRSR